MSSSANYGATSETSRYKLDSFTGSEHEPVHQSLQSNISGTRASRASSNISDIYYVSVGELPRGYDTGLGFRPNVDTARTGLDAWIYPRLTLKESFTFHLREQQWKSLVVRYLAFFCFVLATGAATQFSLFYTATYTVTRHTPIEKVEYVIHDPIRSIVYWETDVPNYAIYVFGALFVLRGWFHPERLRILRRVAFIWLTILVVRDIALILTVYPDADPKCFDFDPHNILIFWKTSLTCGDMMFSGHTLFFLMAALSFSTYTSDHVIFHIVLWLVTLAVTFILIISQVHWSDDVYIAYVVTFLYWHFYHSYISACTAACTYVSTYAGTLSSQWSSHSHTTVHPAHASYMRAGYSAQALPPTTTAYHSATASPYASLAGSTNPSGVPRTSAGSTGDTSGAVAGGGKAIVPSYTDVIPRPWVLSLYLFYFFVSPIIEHHPEPVLKDRVAPPATARTPLMV